MKKTNDRHSQANLAAIRHKYSVGGRYRVHFVAYPEHPNVFEFIVNHPETGERIRYINMDASEGANISKLV